MPIQAETKSRIEKADFTARIADADAPQTIFLFLPQKTGARQDLELVYTCIQSTMNVAASRQIQFYCCYYDRESEGVLYREALSGLLKSAMLESVNHRYRSMAYDAKLVADGQVALCLIQEWLCDDIHPMNIESYLCCIMQMEIVLNCKSKRSPSSRPLISLRHFEKEQPISWLAPWVLWES